jgi:hypothetical protein
VVYGWDGLGADPDDAPWISVGYLGLLFALPMLVSGILAPAVVQTLKGTRPGFLSVLRHAVRAGPALGVALVFLFVFGVILVASSLLAQITSALGVVAFTVLTLYVICALYVAVPAAVVERDGVFASLGRSRVLTRKNRWRILVVVLVLLTASWLVLQLIDEVIDTQDLAGWRLHFVWQVFLVSVVIGSLASTINAVAYHDLRTSREGVSAEELAKVFD